ncbi:MAG TPA: glycine--tRNA ligase subunit beta [Terriglobales bacterium]|nr:glycine--tRNA ligase subunit beta [Terriglobales bacterium]
MPERLLVEVGCEEMPARMVEDLARQFASNLSRQLKEHGLLDTSADPTVAWTPRRLVYVAEAVVEHQPTTEEEVTGPPIKMSVAADGGWTPQAAGFAAKNGLPPSALYRLTNAKGEYVAVKKSTGGASAATILAAAIPAALAEIQLPRSMKWQTSFRFIRPIRWLVVLLGQRAVALKVGEVASGVESRGHRSLGAARFQVNTAADYPGLWHANHVIVEPRERRARIRAHCSGARPDAGLEDTLVNLTEFPDAIVGSFDAKYLRTLPPEVLVTVMRDHQKYFAVENKSGELEPKFIAIINQASDRKGLIRHGNERVLRARFSDAEFFWQTDRKLTLAERLPKLESVTFQAKLGSYRAKATRMKSLAEWLAGQWTDCDHAIAATAAELAKCDLTCETVKEFPELQGIIGGHLARAEKRPESIAIAITDQYAWEQPPRTREGAAVSLADKLDTIVGMFSIGEQPTGSADPFGLRRQANGIVRTLIEMQWPLSVAAACAQAGHADAAQLAAFFRERLAFYLTDTAGFRYDLVAAVLAAERGADIPLDAFRRCAALAAAPDMAAVAAVVKRAGNIVRKEKWNSAEVDRALLAHPSEAALYDQVAGLKGADYAQELNQISGLAEPLKAFFDQVRVNDPDPAIRANRLSLLAWTVARLSRIADFSEIVVA